MQHSVYIFVFSKKSGGVERRIISIWLENALRDGPPSTLVLHPDLLNDILRVPEFSEIVRFKNRINDQIIADGFLSSLKNISTFAKSLSGKVVFHFVNAPPLIFSSAIRKVMTFPSSSFDRLSLKGRALVWLGFLIADAVDILDPMIFEKMRKIYFFKKSKFRLTPGSAVNFSFLDSLKSSSREEAVAFVGLLNADKGFAQLFSQLPEINQKLMMAGHLVHFYLMGRKGDVEYESMLKNKDYSKVTYTLKVTENPFDILLRSKVFLSLQSVTNYPSRSLVEAIACENLLVATDTGTTRLLAKPTVTEYVPREFNAEEISHAIAKQLESYPQKASELEAAKKEVINTYSVSNSATYFNQIYQALLGEV